MIEITLKNETDFLKIRETLTRCGIANNLTKTLWQSCHIFHKRGQLFICHFKELLILDGLAVEFTDEDIQRRNNIAHLLAEWDLCEVVKPTDYPHSDTPNFRVISFKESKSWTLKYKYRIGNK